MILADTGFFIALAFRRDALHAQAHAWSASVAETMLVTEHVLLETVNQLSAPADRGRAAGLMDQVRRDSAFQFLEVDAKLFERGVAMHRERRDKGWSLTDCVSFLVMGDRGVTKALAYDTHFEQAGFEALLRRDPSSA